MKAIFETERLVIRQWQAKDYKDLFEYASDPDVNKFLNYKTYTTLQQAKERICHIREKYKAESRWGEFAIALKGSDKAIGSIWFYRVRERAEGTIRVGWLLNSAFQGKGYMTEAVIGLFKYVKANNYAKRIFACHDVDNVKSGAVMKRAGMTFEGISRRYGENNTHSRYDVANYSILYEEIE